MEGFWARFGGPASVDWCEPNYVHSPFVAEWFNALSSLPIAALGLLAVLSLGLRGGAEGADLAVDPVPARAPTSAAAEEPLPPASPERAGGLAVRLSLARAAFAMWSDQGAVGAGRFQASFPPYREVEETEWSRDGACQGGIREVEHPHDDWILGFVELGLLGGGAWLVWLVLGVVSACRALRRGDAQDAALGAAALG